MELLIFILGTIFGSFYLVIGTRLPKKENIITGRSRCDYCHHSLKWYELIPILSYCLQKGKCNYCHKQIKPIHFIIELITGSLFLIGYLYFHLTWKLLIYLIIVSVALIIYISDFLYMIILDSPLVIGSLLIIIIRYFEVGIKGTLYSIGIGIILFAFMFLIKILGDKIYQRESLGGGDIKLCFLIGLTLGYPYIGFRLSLVALIFSAFLALPYAIGTIFLVKKNELPYGPFLITSMIIVFVFIEKFSNLLIFFNLF